MESAAQLANRFREVLLNGTWIANTNFREQLTNLDWKSATTPVHSLNTIAILTQHVHYYINGLITVFTGGGLDISDRHSFDFPPVQSQQQWEAILNRLWMDAETFASLVEQIPAENLQAPFVNEKYGTLQRNIEGIIEHCYYHLGQIVLLKKLLAEA